MAEFKGEMSPSAAGAGPSSIRPEIDAIHRLRAVVSTQSGPVESDALRTRVMEVGVRAELLQQAACKTCAAIDALTSMEESLLFALDAAREAMQARSLPAGALDRLQSQVDIAVRSLDWQSQFARFGDCGLFCGENTVELEAEKIELPGVSSATIGGSWVDSAAFEKMDTGEVEYSQSVASVLDGGPNCLAQWADGAARALEAGLGQLREIKETLDSFYNASVLPGVGTLAVALSNVIASEPPPGSLKDITAMLEEYKRELGSMAAGTAVSDSQGILELLS